MAAPMNLTLKTFNLLHKVQLFAIGSSKHLRGCRCLATAAASPQESSGKAEKISMAMKAYIERAKDHDAFMKEEITEYEIGKRHLARIMSVDPEDFTQNDIDAAIEYLLPSSLYHMKARPKLKHPLEVLPNRKAAQFGMDGRPFHPQFYTGQPHFYGLMQSMGEKLDMVKKHEDQMYAQRIQPDEEKKMILASSQWVDKKHMEKELQEKISDRQYEQFVRLMERLSVQPFAYTLKEVIFQYRTPLQSQDLLKDIPQLMYTETGRPYMTAEGQRKTARARVTVWGNGRGEVTINGRGLLEVFPSVLDRQQLLFPLALTERLDSVDVEAEVEQGGTAGQAGAVRLGLARALQSFVDREMVDRMRLAGLLTRDPRIKERKKYGQARARRGFTWKKR